MLADAALRAALVGGYALLALGVAASLRPGPLVARAPAVLLGLALVSGLAAAACFRLEPLGLRLALDPSTERLLPARDPGRAAYERAVLDFGNDELFAIAMETEAGVFTRENLLALAAVHERIARLPGVRSVQSPADVVTFRYDPEEDWVEVGRLFDTVPEDAAALAALRDRALGDPLLRGSVVSEDGRVAGLSVRFAPMTDAEFLASGLDERIAELLRAAERPGLAFHVSGRPHLKAAVYRGMIRDLRVLIPLAVLVLAGVLAVATGTRRGIVLPLASVLLAVLWTYGAMALLGRPITILSSMLGPQLIAIGSVYGVHLLAHYDEERRGPGDGPAIAARTLAHVRLAVAISGATTQIGFSAICLSDVPAVLDLGAFSVLGVGAISFLTLTGLPAALALLPPRREASALPPALARASERFGLELARGLDALHDFAVRRAGACIAAAVALAGVAAFAIPRIVVDTDYLSFFREEAPVRVDFDAVNRLLAGAIPIYVVVEGSGAGTFRDPEALRALERLQAALAGLPGVSRVGSVADTLRAMNRAVEGGDPAEERIPDARAGVSELLQLAPKDELQRFVNVNASRANVIVRTGEVGSQAIRTLERRLALAIEGELPDGLRGAPAANAILLARSADGIAASQLQSVGLATAAIFVLVAAALRSFTLGAIALLPNVFPVLLFFGLLGLCAAPLSLPTSLIASVALGIAVDDTVHFLVRYRRERRAGASPEAAAHATGHHVGTPIAITALMLSAGFGSIGLSEFETLREFGWLFATTIGICLAADLLLLPALLVRVRA